MSHNAVRTETGGQKGKEKNVNHNLTAAVYVKKKKKTRIQPHL